MVGGRPCGVDRSNFGQAQQVGALKIGLRRYRTRNLAGARRGFHRAPLRHVSRPVSRVLEGLRTQFADVTAIPLGRRLPGASSNLPGRQDPDTIPKPARASLRAVPIRSCSRWGLPCRRRYRRRGALLPHRFTLAAANTTHRGGLFSVALSLGSHPPDVIRHRLSMEPGLSSPATFRFCRSGRPAD